MQGQREAGVGPLPAPPRGPGWRRAAPFLGDAERGRRVACGGQTGPDLGGRGAAGPG